MDPEAFYDLTLPTDVAVAPDGDRIAFPATESDPDEDERRTSLFVAPADGSEDPYRLTRASDAGSPAWSPDGSTLAFTAAREEDAELAVGSGDDDDEDEDEEANGNGDDEPKSQVWAFDMERGGDARQLTTVEEGVREFDWAPDGERLVVSARDPTEEQQAYLDRRREEDGPIEVERLQHTFDGTGWLDDVRTYLFVVDVDDRGTTRLDDAWDLSLPEAAAGLAPRWGPGGRIAFRASPEHSDDSYAADLYTIDPDGGGLERHTDGDLTVTTPRWGPDGDRIAFAGRDPENWYKPTEVYLFDGDGYRSLSGDLDRTVAWAGAPEWVDGDALLAPVGDEGRTRLVRFHADGSPPERVFDAQGDGRTVTQFDLAGGTIGCCLSEPDDGADVYALDAGVVDGDAAPTRLSRVNADLLEGVDLPAADRIAFENGDGDTIEAIVYRPPGEEDPHPLVAKIHGGPIAYDAPRFDFETALWTSKGYAVVNVNYRGSSSYGRDFSEVIRGEWGPMETHDVLRGVEELVDRGWADPDRLFVTGFSYGGMTTAHAVATTDRFAAAAAEHGIYDYRASFGTDDAHAWWEADFGLPWEHAEAYERASSITDVGDMETPLLVTAGEEDWRCPPSQAEQLYVSVRKRGVDAKLVVYPGEHHDVGDPDRAIHRLEELLGWFEDHDPGA